MTTKTEKPLVNRVAQSGLITLDLEEYAPSRQLMEFDLSEFLFKGLVLREKDFRASLTQQDWSKYADAVLLIFCATDAIVPKWAYMLVASLALPYADSVFFGNTSSFLERHYEIVVAELDVETFRDARVVVKGCSGGEVPASAYVAIQSKLQPVVRSLMYGEPCSTVPIYKRKNN
jgi:hypothetical protein